MIEKGKKAMEHDSPLIRRTGSDSAGLIDGQSLEDDEKAESTGSRIWELSRDHSTGKGMSYSEESYWIARTVDTGGSFVHVKDSMGVQGGEHNLQENVFVSSLECTPIDLDQVLAKPEVQEIFGLLAESPGDRSIANRADSVLARGPRWLEARGSVTVERMEDISSSQTSSFAFDFISFLIEDSQGVALGNYCVQENEFVFSLKSNLTATQVVASSSELRREIIESVRREGAIPTSDRSVLDSLTSALEVAASGVGGVPSAGRVIKPPRKGVVNVSNELGVTIGKAVTQNNSTQVVVATPTMRATCLDFKAEPARDSGIFSIQSSTHSDVEYDEHEVLSFRNPYALDSADNRSISIIDLDGERCELQDPYDNPARDRNYGDRYDEYER